MKSQTNAVIRCTALAGLFLAFSAAPAHALTRTWDGGAATNLWSTAENWDPDGLPVANDTVIIDSAVTVDWTGGAMSAWNVTLSNGASLRADVNYARLNGATINLGPASILSNTSGKGWDLSGGKLNFQNGAAAPIGDWELKGFNSFSFKLGPAGFTKLTPTTLRWQAVDKFTKSTWNVDMADYTGPSPASIVLVDFTNTSGDPNMTAANFLAQATQTVTNAGANVGSTIVYDPFMTAIVLKVQVAPYVAPLADSVWDGGAGTTAWTTAANWDPDFLPPVNGAVAIDGAVTVDMTGLGSGALPSGVKIALTNGATLTNTTDVCRMNGASSVSVGSGCTLNKFWAMGSGSMSFQNGAIWSAGDVELSGPNVFSFKLGPAGFTKLTPGVLRWDPTKEFTQQTWTVDMADYTGPSPASIILMDCSSAFYANMTAANFLAQATRTVTNAGANVGSTIVYDRIQAAFVLKVQVDPYVAPVADLVWDGGGGSVLWATAANWDPDFTPVAGNKVAIASAVTVDCPNVSLPACTISLMNHGAMTSSTGAVRLQGATINVASGSALSGGFWDMNNGTINFQNGALATVSNWELKGTTRFTFKLGAAGFTKLTPGILRGAAGTIAASTWIADMADYTGGPGIIPLVDYTSDSYNGGMTDALLQTAGLSVINLGVGYAANLQWNHTTKAIELNVTAAPGNSYASWAAAHAGGQAADLDFDNDGVNNGVEFFMNAPAGFTANPVLNGSNQITWTNGGNLAPVDYGTQYVVQTSSDLAIWVPVSVGDLTSNTSGPGGSLTYTLSGAAPRFVRLMVTP